MIEENIPASSLDLTKKTFLNDLKVDKKTQKAVDWLFKLLCEKAQATWRNDDYSLLVQVRKWTSCTKYFTNFLIGNTSYISFQNI